MELLAPAGGPEQLRLATHFGADAVFLAGRRWGMRARSANFTDEELGRAVGWAHGQGVSVHLALNALMSDRDMDDLPPYLRLIDEIGVDAAIVADLGALMAVREHAPHVEVHLSTQASVMSAATADAWAGLDAIKLEGRAKGGYYAACVTNAYRQVLDGAAVGPWREELDAVSHRPYSTGFFYGDPTQNPGRVDYARERSMVALVCGCEARYGGFLVEVECRNRALREEGVQVLSPGEWVREARLTGLEALDGKTGRWVPVDVMAHNMCRYRFRCAFPLSRDDVVCVRAEAH